MATRWRMLEADPLSDIQQLRLDRGSERVETDPQLVRRSPNQCGIPDGVCGSHEEQLLRRRRQRDDLPQVVVLEVPGELDGVGEVEAPGELGCAHAARQFEQSQWIAAGFADDPIADALVQSTWEGRREQDPRGLLLEAAEGQLGKSCQHAWLGGVANGEHGRHRLRQQSTRDEPENLARHAVQPLRIVNEAASSPNSSASTPPGPVAPRLTAPLLI